MCSLADCPGVAPAVASAGAEDGRAQRQLPVPTACRSCGTRHCGRRVCGAPWTEGHRCWDLVEEERRRAEQDLEARARHRSLDAHLANTRRRLAWGPRFRPCPTCSVMVEHVGGCNMVYHDSCRTRWCFVCRRVGTCSDFDCRTPGSGPPTPRTTSGPPTPRGVPGGVPGTAQTSSSPRKVSGLARAMLAALMLCVSLVMYATLGLQMVVPRNGFLGFGLNTDTCQSGASCKPPQEDAADVAVNVQLAVALQPRLEP